MLKEFLEKLLELKRPEIVIVDGREYATSDLEPVKEPVCGALNVYNLESLVTYLKNDPDNRENERKIINIVSPVEVRVESSLFGNFKQRETYIRADYSELTPNIYFGKFLSIEEFIIMLKSKFEMTEELTNILKIVGNVQDENVTNYNDDGVTQKVTARTGIARLDEVALPPKIRLKPYRTFVEVDQPESEFLLRAQKGYKGVEFALFEADGGAWKKTTITDIAMYLRENLHDVENITILN